MKVEGERGVLRARQSGIAVAPTRRVGVLACLAGCSMLALLCVDAAAKARHGHDATKTAAKPSADKSATAKPSADKPSAAKSSTPKSSSAKSSAPKSSPAKSSPAKSSAHTAAAAHPKDCIKSSAKTAAAGAKRHRKSNEDCATPPPLPAVAELPGELGDLQKAVRALRAGKLSDVAALAPSIHDPVAQKLIAWVRLRDGDSAAGFDRYAAFIRDNPSWPLATLRRRAEARLWQERRDAATVRGFIAGAPVTSKGKLTLARLQIVDGDRDAAMRDIRATWRSDELSAETETAVLDAFGDALTRADHAARMDRRIGAKDFGAAMRAAKRVGDGAVAIVKACAAAEKNASDARKLLDAVPDDARGDLGYALCRIHDLVRQNDLAAAAKLVLAAAPDALQFQDTDEWWRERRMLARKLLDKGDAKTAYLVARDAAEPANRYYRADFNFMAGWIALRWLEDPATALAHFSAIDAGATDPIVLSRAAYWRGRAHEAAGHTDQMQAQYQIAAGYSTAYYGQLARARLGFGAPELRTVPQLAGAEPSEVVRAAELLYTIGERELALSFATDLAETCESSSALAALGDLAARQGDARAVMLIGKAGLARGMPLELFAFPDIGVPSYRAVGPALDRSVVYSIVRTESEFNQRDVSPAKAVGLMQVTPEAGRDTAKRLGVANDWKKLVDDPVYNTQMGAGEIAALLADYRGSHIMTFAGYNAGRGRVQEWVAAHGDPRDPKVDPVDWVERIPFSETRNYVQRVMENLAVYRVRFNAGATAAAAPAPKAEAKPAELDSQHQEAVAK